MSKLSLGRLTRVFQFCLGNLNSASKLPGLPTLMLLPSTSTSIHLLGKTVRNHAEGVRRGCADKTVRAYAVSLKSLDKSVCAM